jgi:beta-glucosidase
MGEDPFLTSAMAVSYVKGLQSTGTIATIKHFIGNEQEFARHIVNVKIGERALREIYLPPFEASITDGGALAVMTGNNLVNGYPGAADKPLSEGVLRKEYGFKGIIMSDWANGMFWPKEQQRALGSGQSLFMSNNKIFADYVHRQIKAHPGRKAAMEKDLDTMVFHNLYTFFKDGIYDRPYRDPSLVNKIEGHQKTALQTAEEAITLLKNTDHILPIDPAKVNRIVVVGTPEALKVYTGTGSGKVEGYDQVDYPTGLENIYGSKIIHSRTISDDQIRSADVVLYFINKHAGEGSDKPFVLPRVDSMVNRYAALNKNLVVVYSGGNGLAMPWLQKTKAFVFAYLLGQQSGTALARVISGAVSPSGKLPFTIEKSFRQSPAYDYNKMRDSSYYWGGGKRDSRMMEKFGPIDLTYKEGIYMGYRWYDKKKFAPQFPFGFGLSYTTFDFSKIHLSSTSISKDKPVMVEVTITNTGSSAGAEVAQLYIHAIHSKIDRPVMALKGFKRILLKAGESKKIQIPLKLHDLAYWSETSHDWQVDHGRYEIALGASSKDIRQKAIIQY